MDTKEFKSAFNKIAKNNGFVNEFGGWFMESNECIVVLDLQKSNYGNYFELNIKIYIQGIFGKTYKKSKDLVKKDVGDIFTRQPNSYRDIFDLDKQIEEDKRLNSLKKLFSDYLAPLVKKVSTKRGIIELEQKNELFILPAIKKELGLKGT